MSTTAKNTQDIAEIKTWINSVITNSKLPSELVELTEVTTDLEFGVLQKETETAQKVKSSILRGYKGSYDALANTPAISDGIGVDLDTYYVSVAGSQDFGSGEISMEVGDLLIYVSGIWVKIGCGATTELLGYALTTGVRTGGFLSPNVGDPSKFDISDGDGLVVDIFTNPDSPTIEEVGWSGLVGLTATYLPVDNISFVAIDSLGSVIQQPTDFSPEQRRDLIVLGTLVHTENTVITETTDSSHGVTDSYLADDLQSAIGAINISGNNLVAASTDLTVRKEAGNSFGYRSNRINNIKDPNFITSGVSDPVTFLYIYNDGSGGVTVVPSQTNIDSNLYDDGSGVLAAVPNNKWTVQWFYFFPGGNLYIIRYGESFYDSETDAKLASTIVAPTSIGTGLTPDLIRTSIVLKKGVLDLSNELEATFIDTGKFGFGGGGGSSSGGVTQDLQDTYNNSVTPEIITDSTRGAFTLRRGSASDTDNVFEVVNGAGDIVGYLKGNGSSLIGGDLEVSDRLTIKNLADNLNEMIRLETDLTGVGAVNYIETFDGDSNVMWTIGNTRISDENLTIANAKTNGLVEIYVDGGGALDRIFVDSSGNLGVGTDSPTSKLQVVGLPIHADNAAALLAGLTAGAFYHNGDGIVRVVF